MDIKVKKRRNPQAQEWEYTITLSVEATVSVPELDHDQAKDLAALDGDMKREAHQKLMEAVNNLNSREVPLEE